MHRPPHILNAASNLMGICFVTIGGLKFTNSNTRSYADEIAWVATALMFTSLISAYLALRNEGARPWQVRVADWSFLGGVASLITALIVGAIYL